MPQGGHCYADKLKRAEGVITGTVIRTFFIGNSIILALLSNLSNIAILSIEQNLTFEYADKIFAEKEVKFGREQKQSLGLIRPDGRYTNLALILSD